MTIGDGWSLVVVVVTVRGSKGVPSTSFGLIAKNVGAIFRLLLMAARRVRNEM